MADPPATSPKIAIITAGAGGMYCGSCLHDNFVATSLRAIGVDAVLIPTYTPIRTDTDNVSIDRVFFGGINVFLQEKIGLFRYLPKFMDSWLDNPRLIRWITSRKMDTDPTGLGPLTLSMLKGADGRQKKEVEHLAKWLADDLKPDLIVFSNMLIAGCAPELKRQVGCPILVTLQGDDVFLDGLPESDRTAAIEEMQKIDASVNGYVAHSQFYADYMADYLGLEREKIHQIPIGIDADDLLTDPSAARPSTESLTIGYLARLAPEKGLHLLCDAMQTLRSMPEMGNVRLKIAGWQDERHRQYAESHIGRLRNACGDDAVEVVGEVTREQKAAFLRSLDVFCVPTEFQEPKGMYVLEALAAGVPVVQPNHGAFPERLNPVGGTLFTAADTDDLARVLSELLQDPPRREQLASAGIQVIRKRHSPTSVAEKTMDVYKKFIAGV